MVGCQCFCTYLYLDKMGSHLHVLFRILCTHLLVFRCALTTLMQSYKRTPNIFTLVQKVKSVMYFFLFFK